MTSGSVWQITQLLWVPPLFLRNAHNSRIPEVVTSNQILYARSSGSLVHVVRFPFSFALPHTNADGSKRTIVSLTCIQNLTSFPFDTQLCSIELALSESLIKVTILKKPSGTLSGLL